MLYISFVNVQGIVTAHSKTSDNHKLCQNFQAVLWMCSPDEMASRQMCRVVGGYLQNVKGFCDWRASKMGQLEGFSLGEMAGMKRKRKQETQAMPTAEAGSGQSHESNDRRQ